MKVCNLHRLLNKAFIGSKLLFTHVNWNIFTYLYVFSQMYVLANTSDLKDVCEMMSGGLNSLATCWSYFRILLRDKKKSIIRWSWVSKLYHHSPLFPHVIMNSLSFPFTHLKNVSHNIQNHIINLVMSLQDLSWLACCVC